MSNPKLNVRFNLFDQKSKLRRKSSNSSKIQFYTQFTLFQRMLISKLNTKPRLMKFRPQSSYQFYNNYSFVQFDFGKKAIKKKNKERKKSNHTFLDQTIFGVGFPLARHSNLIDAPFETSKRVGGATYSIRGGTVIIQKQNKNHFTKY